MGNKIYFSISVKNIDSKIEKLKKIRDLIEEINHEPIEIKVDYKSNFDRNSSCAAVSNIDCQESNEVDCWIMWSICSCGKLSNSSWVLGIKYASKRFSIVSNFVYFFIKEFGNISWKVLCYNRFVTKKYKKRKPTDIIKICKK